MSNKIFPQSCGKNDAVVTKILLCTNNVTHSACQKVTLTSPPPPPSQKHIGVVKCRTELNNRIIFTKN